MGDLSGYSHKEETREEYLSRLQSRKVALELQIKNGETDEDREYARQQLDKVNLSLRFTGSPQASHP